VPSPNQTESLILLSIKNTWSSPTVQHFYAGTIGTHRGTYGTTRYLPKVQTTKILPGTWVPTGAKIPSGRDIITLFSHENISVADPDRVRRIRMVLGLPDPDPLVRGTDPDPSIIKQK
jgi:hypothetical protein